MKGKGEKGNKNVNAASNDDSSLQFPSIKSIDHIRHCPRFTSILNKDEDDCITLEEMDVLQTELESMLNSSIKRAKIIQNEIQMLNSWQEKGKDKLGMSPASAYIPITPALSSSSEPSTPVGKRIGKGASVEDKPAKRMRTDSGRATYAQPTSNKGKGKHLQDNESQESPSTSNTRTVEIIRAPKNITPNRFWAMVEPYCANITKDDLKFLEEQIEMCEDIGDYLKIPPLGKHYTEKWAEEDLLHEQKEASKLGERGERRKCSANVYPASNIGVLDNSSNKFEDFDDDSDSVFGPLTQRLIQGLIEENLMTSLDDNLMLTEADATEAATISPKILAKQLHLGNTTLLEKRIKKELEEIGVLGLDDENIDESIDDEILVELKKKQAELKTLSQQNSMMLKNLHKLAKEEMSKQELKNKLAAADAEVLDIYRKFQATKNKRKVPSKKDRDIFFRAIQERKSILKQIQNSNTS